MKSNKLINISIFALVILLATSFTVTAFGVTSLYWDGDALRGSLIPIKLYFVTKAEGGSGQLALGTGITKGFDVLVSGQPSPVADKLPVFEKPQEEGVKVLSNKEIVAAIVVVLLVVIIWIFLKRSKRNQRGNKRGAIYLPQQNKHDQW
jgi:hypothetical protein